MKRRAIAATAVGVFAFANYIVLDAADLLPGLLTTRPLPPPPPTETAGTRTLPVIPQPTVPTTPPALPLPTLQSAAPSAAKVKTAVSKVVGLPALSDSALVVRDGQSGDVLYAQDADSLRIPASTTKLLSAAAIGQVFTPDETLRTVVKRGPAKDRITLVAGGDTLLAPGKGKKTAVAGRAGLADLADQVAARLKKDAVGSVRVDLDLSYAAGPALADTWGRDFTGLGIVTPVSMLGRSDQRSTLGVAAPKDPAGSTGQLFVELLRKRGITAELGDRIEKYEQPGQNGQNGQGSQTPGPTASGTPTDSGTGTSTGASGTDPNVLGVVESAPVRDQLALALTDSDNTLTEVLARQAAFRSGAQTSFPGTGAWVVSQIKALGVPTDGVTLRDASGLSRENRVTASLLSQLIVLGYDGKHPVLRTALEGMPIAGLTGTLGDRFGTASTSQAAGRVRAKTGTLTGANAIAGTVVADNGRLLVFVGLVADAPTLEARAALDRFIAAIAACGC